jgi:hypothetical protein
MEMRLRIGKVRRCALARAALLPNDAVAPESRGRRFPTPPHPLRDQLELLGARDRPGAQCRIRPSFGVFAVARGDTSDRHLDLRQIRVVEVNSAHDHCSESGSEHRLAVCITGFHLWIS